MKSKIMLRRVVFIFGLLIVCTLGSVQAQDPIYSQYNPSSLYTNPALVGLSGSPITGTVGYRSQWQSMDEGYQSTYASVEYSTLSYLNLGLLIDYDHTGSAGLQTTGFSAVVGYMLPLTKSKYNRRTKKRSNYWYIQPALQLGFVSKGFYSGYKNVDDIIDGTPDNSATQGLSAMFPEVTMGFVLSNNEYWVGTAVHHLVSRTADNSDDLLKPAEMKITAHAGLLKDVAPHTKAGGSIIWRSQAGVMQSDLTANVNHSLYANEQVFTVGASLGYRTFFDGQSEGNRDAIIFGTAISYNIIKFGYSYDHTVSNLSNYSSGSHEITLTIIPSRKIIDEWKERFVRHNNLMCPEFLK